MKIWSLCLAFILLGGCTVWPEHGQSGPGVAGKAQHWPEIWEETARESPATLLAQLERLQLRLEVLGLKSAQLCLPGSMYENRLLAERIGKEIHGGLFIDAENDLVILQDKVQAMEQRMVYLARHTLCAVSNDMATVTVSSGGLEVTPPHEKTHEKGLVSIPKVKDWMQGFRQINKVAGEESGP